LLPLNGWRCFVGRAADPTGEFCLWDVVTLSAATNNITSVTIAGTVSNYFGIDDLRFSITTPPTATEENTWGEVKQLFR